MLLTARHSADDLASITLRNSKIIVVIYRKKIPGGITLPARLNTKKAQQLLTNVKLNNITLLYAQ